MDESYCLIIILLNISLVSILLTDYLHIESINGRDPFVILKVVKLYLIRPEEFEGLSQVLVFFGKLFLCLLIRSKNFYGLKQRFPFVTSRHLLYNLIDLFNNCATVFFEVILA